MRFTADQKMASVILGNHLLLPVLGRFSIPLGFGEMTVAEVCSEHNIHLPFFLEVLNAFHDPEYRPVPDPQNFPVPMTVAYLRSAHHYYLDQEVPAIGRMITDFVENAGEWKVKMSAILRFFEDYTRELTLHIGREEDVVFPYALEVDKACRAKEAPEELISRIREYPVSAYAGDHDNVEEKLLDLKNILIKYIHPSLDNEPVRRILDHLFELEADLNDHSRLEDLILVPVLIPMEQQLLEMSGKKA